MTTYPATFTMEVVAPEAASILITGDVTNACEKDLAVAHEKATSSGARHIILDFSSMEYMNSGGIGMLVTTLVRAQRQRQTLAAIGLSDHYRDIFSLTRLDEAISLFDSLDAALASQS